MSQNAKQSKLINNFVQASKYCSLFGGGSGNKTKPHGNGVGSKIGVVRPGACENFAVLCARAVRADGYRCVAHFTACTTVHASRSTDHDRTRDCIR